MRLLAQVGIVSAARLGTTLGGAGGRSARPYDVDRGNPPLAATGCQAQKVKSVDCEPLPREPRPALSNSGSVDTGDHFQDQACRARADLQEDAR